MMMGSENSKKEENINKEYQLSLMLLPPTTQLNNTF